MSALSACSCDDRFDVAVIGGGVVGCAVARRLTLDGARVVLLERGADILAGASKANSAILHTGFDAPPDTLELACIRRGYAEYLAIRGRLDLPVLRTGAMVVAWTEAEAEALAGIHARASANGVDDVYRLERAAVLAREPQLADDVAAALLVPGEHLVDPWSAPLAYLTQAVANGAKLRRRTAVEAGSFDGRAWSLTTTGGTVRAGAVVNAAGLFGDRLEQRLMGDCDFEIRPRKGQFVVFDKAAAALLRTTLLPVPTERTKGVVVARTIFGNLLVGPTAEEQAEREHARVDTATLRALVERAERMLPGLAGMPVTATYAGLRPASEAKPYRVRFEPERAYLRLGGIRSTGLTAALGLAEHAADRLREIGIGGAPLAEPVWPTVPNLAEHRPRPWQGSEGGDIVCHCERVTRGEILRALGGPLAAGDLGGLKRRTRVMLGRCQGFYCGAAVARLTAERWEGSLALAEPARA